MTDRFTPQAANNSRFSRRQMLQLGAAAAGGAMFDGWDAHAMRAEEQPAKKAGGDDDLERGYIDAHVHVWTPNTSKYPLAAGRKRAEMKPPSFTPEELLAHARPCGVRRIVLIQMSFYGFDNSYMRYAIRNFPRMFSGVAVIDENAQPAATMRKLAEQGVRGFRIRPGDRPVDRWLDGDGMAAMWKCGAEEGLSMCHLVDANSLPAIDRMCRKHPETPVVIDHFARIGVDGQIREADLKALYDLGRYKHTSVKVSAFYALGKKQPPYVDLIPMIRRLLDSYGPERLMWATDCPYQVQEGHTYSQSIELVRDRLDFLSDSDRDYLLRKTAQRVFFS